MNAEELERLWSNPEHWTAWSYNCAEDPRLIVPKRNPILGWTINAAHPRAASMALFMLAGCIVPFMIVLLTAGFSILSLLGAFVLSTAVLGGICIYLARTYRL